MLQEDIDPQVRDILHGHADVLVTQYPNFWRVQATHGATAHSATGEDPLALARHIARLAEQDVQAAGTDPALLDQAAGGETVSDELQPSEEAAPSSPAADPIQEPVSLEALAQAGVMLVEDERAWRVGTLTGRIAQAAEHRIAVRYDASRRHDMARTMADFTNKVALGLGVTDEERAAFDEAQAIDRWIMQTRAFGQSLFLALPDLPLNMLQVYDVDAAPWPALP